jgi:hypothetical protein
MTRTPRFLSRRRAVGFLAATIITAVLLLPAGAGEDTRQEVAVFIGGVHNSDSEDAFSIGLEYEYRLNEAWGIGGIVDYADLDPGESVLAVPAYFHITDAWKVLVAPGVSHTSDEDEFLVRVGTAYTFDFESFRISPALDVDFVDGEETFIYGMNFGLAF